MHNRVRMLTASFLVKHLLVDWRRGERWFWDCLVDADYGNNSVNWQWVAGTGVDSSPFGRIMAPLAQSEKFDAADYIRRWVPELADLDDADIHDPHAAGVAPAHAVDMGSVQELQTLQALLADKEDRIKELESALRQREEEMVQLRSHLDKFQSVFPYSYTQLNNNLSAPASPSGPSGPASPAPPRARECRGRGRVEVTKPSGGAARASGAAEGGGGLWGYRGKGWGRYGGRRWSCVRRRPG